MGDLILQNKDIIIALLAFLTAVLAVSKTMRGIHNRSRGRVKNTIIARNGSNKIIDSNLGITQQEVNRDNEHK